MPLQHMGLQPKTQHTPRRAQVMGATAPPNQAACLRIGPGIFELGGQTVSHPYDGHGIVASISFHDGRAFFRSKFVNTAE